jgi:hypothetical protein
MSSSSDANDSRPEIVDLSAEYAAEEEALNAAAAATAASSLPEITFHLRRWWGFELHCNQPALEAVDRIRSLVISVTTRWLPFPIPDAIGIYLFVRSLAIGHFTQGRGARLVSPWTVPLLLTPRPLIASPPPPAPPVPPPDTALRWTVFDRNVATEWSEPELFPAHHSVTGPSLAVHGDRLFCMRQGDPNNEWLMSIDYHPDTGWSENRTINVQANLISSPALVEFQGSLYCFFRGRVREDETIYWRRFDGTNWSSGSNFPTVGFRSDPNAGMAVAVFGDRIICVYRGPGSDNRLRWTEMTPNPSGDPSIPLVFTPERLLHDAQRTSVAPSLAVFNGQLICAYLNSSGHAMSVNFDGHAWSTHHVPMLPTDMRSVGAPSLVVFNNELHALTFRPGQDGLVQTTLEWGNHWRAPQIIQGHRSTAPPGVAAYRDKHADSEKRDQLMCIYRGSP